MRISRALAVCVLAAVGASSCGEFPTLELDALSVTSSTTTVATTINRPVTPFKPVTANGGSQQYSYAISGLPAGLVADASTGTVSGTPTEIAANRTLTVTVTDTKQSGVTANGTYALLTVNAAPTGGVVPTFASVQVTQGAAFTTFTPMPVTGGTAPLVYAATGLPAGLSINAGTGAVSGTPTTANTTAAAVTITATDAAGATATGNFTIRVNDALVTTLANAAPVCTINAPCSFTPVTVAGGTSPRTFTISPALPVGVFTLNATTGVITGTPTTALPNTTYRVTVADAANASSFRDFQLSISNPLTATVLIASKGCTQNTACVFTPVQGGGGAGSLLYSTTALPIGLSINSGTGAISGTPTGTQVQSTVTVTVKDANDATVSNTFQLTVNPPITTVQSVSAKVCTQGSPCNAQALTASGGTTPYVYSVTPALPAGLTLNTATGALTGPATATSAQATYTASVTDANLAPSTNRTFTLAVNAPLTTVVGQPAYACTVGALCAITPVTPSGGSNLGNGGAVGFTFTLSPAPSNLAQGLTFDAATGAISGTATGSMANTTFTITVTDGAGDQPRATSSKSFDFVVNGPLSTNLATSAVTTTVNIALANAFPGGVRPVIGSGGTGTLTYNVAPALPAGLTFNTATGQITGTPTQIGNTLHEVTVTDQAAASSKKSFTLTINPPLVATQAFPSKACTQNAVCSTYVPITATGGTATYTYAVTPALPAGMSLNTTTGQVGGIPTATLVASQFTVVVTDAATATASNTFTLVVNPPVATTANVTDFACGDINGCTSPLPVTPVSGTSGTAPLLYTLTGGTLPAGLSFNTANGQFTGVSTAIAAFPYTTMTVTVTDAANGVSAKSFGLSSLRSLLPIPAQTCTLGSPCSFVPVTGSGGKTPYVYSLVGTLPGWATFTASTGTISGTPNATQSAQSFDMNVQDALGRQSVQTFTLAVGASTLSTTLAIPEIGCSDASGCTTVIPFTPVTHSGGFGTVTYALTGGSLPTGLSFNTANGAISGTLPTSSLSTTAFTVTVTDQTTPTAQSSAKTFNLSVLLTAATGGSTQCTTTVVCSITAVSASGGKAPIVWSVSGSDATALGALGLTLNTSTGAITGTPSVAGTVNSVAITATDALGRASSKSATITVIPKLTTTQAIPEIGCDDQNGCSLALPFTPVTASGGVGTKTFAISAPLPAGMTFNTTTGAVGGTLPTTPLLQTSFTVTVTDQTTPTPQTSNQPFLLSNLVAATTGQNSCAVATPCSILPVSATGGKPGLTWSVNGTDAAALLAMGLTLNSGGAITGASPTTGTATGIVITVTDTLGRTSARTVTITVP